MSERARLLEQINAKAIVRGRVTLSSGGQADWYVDLRRISLDGRAAPLVGRVMRDALRRFDYEAVGGPTMGADPVVSAIMLAAADEGAVVDGFVVRNAGKAHGLQRRVEGPDIAGRRVVVVDDTSTTGGGLMKAVLGAREVGADVVGVGVIVDRGARSAVEAAGLDYVAAFEMDELDV